jgi:hypothetical protein
MRDVHCWPEADLGSGAPGVISSSGKSLISDSVRRRMGGSRLKLAHTAPFYAKVLALRPTLRGQSRFEGLKSEVSNAGRVHFRTGSLKPNERGDVVGLDYFGRNRNGHVEVELMRHTLDYQINS